MRMEIYIKDNGLMRNNMEKEIIYIIKIMQCTKVIGKKVRKKDLDN